MQTSHQFSTFALGIVILLSLLLLISPGSPSTQPSSFSLALDLDDADGDQAVSSLDVSPDQVVPIQIFGSDIQGASSLSTHFEYDSTQVVYEGFDAGGVLSDAQVVVEQDSTSVRVGMTSLSGSVVNAGLIGTVRFRTTDVFLETEVRLVRAELDRGEQSDGVSLSLSVALQVAASPSPDFDGSGRVNFADFLLFAGAFGYGEGDEKYEAKYDLNSDGGVGFDDFEVFARSFGNTVNRAPVFTVPSPVTRSIAENTPAGRPVGDPVSARDADGNTLTYGLRGADADSFAIDAGTGQIKTQGTYDFEQKSGYSVIVRVSDGEGGHATIVVSIAVTDVDEPPGRPSAPRLKRLSVPPGIGVSLGRTPPVNTGPDINAWRIRYREKDSGGDFITTTHKSADLDARIENLTKGVTYEVQVRAKNDEGDSEWSPLAEIELPNEPPVAVGSFDDLTLAAGGPVEIVSVSGVFSSQDGDRLTYSAASGNSGAASVEMIGREVLVDPGSAGSATITVTASDPYGASDSESFDVSVQTPALSAPTLTVSNNLFTLAFTDDFAADETRAYEVRIRHKTNHGAWATGCHTGTNDQASPQSISVTLQDAVSDFFEPGTTYEADYGYLGDSCDGSLMGSRSATAEVTTSGTASFDIDLVFVGSISSTHRSLVEAAAARWEQIITGDLPNHRLSTEVRDDLNRRFSGTTAPEVVDDLVVYVTSGSTVGIASATSLWHRTPSSLPLASRITLGTRYVLNDLVVLHEMGHALGFGTYPWNAHNLLQNPSRGPFQTLIDPSPDTYFSGAKAISAFNTAGGSNSTGNKVPVENSSLNASSRDSHWRQSVMQSELMTPGLSSTAPLSAITIQSMADLGYTVDVTQADAYTLPATSKIVIGPEGQIPLDCVIEHPEAGLEKPEPIILNLRRVGESE